MKWPVSIPIRKRFHRKSGAAQMLRMPFWRLKGSRRELESMKEARIIPKIVELTWTIIMPKNRGPAVFNFRIREK